MGAISFVSLFITGVLCAVGALHPRFEDNTLQRVGMGCICLSSVALMDHIARYGGTSPACSLMSIGMLVYASGVVVKVAKRQKPLTFPKIEG